MCILNEARKNTSPSRQRWVSTTTQFSLDSRGTSGKINNQGRLLVLLIQVGSAGKNSDTKNHKQRPAGKHVDIWIFFWFVTFVEITVCNVWNWWNDSQIGIWTDFKVDKFSIKIQFYLRSLKLFIYFFHVLCFMINVQTTAARHKLLSFLVAILLWFSKLQIFPSYSVFMNYSTHSFSPPLPS